MPCLLYGKAAFSAVRCSQGEGLEVGRAGERWDVEGMRV